jgi:exo-1,4-beta-D-glucosaminidase
VVKQISDWKMQSPNREILFGDVICSEDFDTNKWIDTKIPNTVVGSLYDAGKIDDIYFGKNMFETEGFKTEAKDHFAWNPMPKDSPYKNPVWYRTEFEIDDKSTENRWWIKFHGLNFRAEIWLNGKRIASETGCAGTYRQYDFDVTKWIHRYNKNVLAVKITAQRHDELGLTFVDWIPTPPDDNAGIWQRVEFYSTAKIAIKEPFVNPVLTNDLKKTSVDFSCRLLNNNAEKFLGKLKIALDEGKFVEYPVEIEKFDECVVNINNTLFLQNVANRIKLSIYSH